MHRRAVAVELVGIPSEWLVLAAVELLRHEQLRRAASRCVRFRVLLDAEWIVAPRFGQLLG